MLPGSISHWVSAVPPLKATAYGSGGALRESAAVLGDIEIGRGPGTRAQLAVVRFMITLGVKSKGASL